MSGEINASQGKPSFDWDEALRGFGQPAINNQVTTPILTTELSLSGFNSCRLSIALSPNGVAAESKPKKLAAKFNVMYETDS